MLSFVRYTSLRRAMKPRALSILTVTGDCGFGLSEEIETINTLRKVSCFSSLMIDATVNEEKVSRITYMNCLARRIISAA